MKSLRPLVVINESEVDGQSNLPRIRAANSCHPMHETFSLRHLYLAIFHDRLHHI